MTQLRKDVMELVDQIPEDKLIFVIQIMQGMKGLYEGSGNSKENKKSEDVESIVQSLVGAIPSIDMTLEDFREERLRKYEAVD
ncbi:MAG: UDP-N-acetylenolpyruvoylglucosamine reductase [Lachnospiraceae bacterium]|nr:UDP-N-acetylenolpyruvoylglucosamine reductase [Lachnospiraceae bacterium]